jgi:hypothetical protein
MPQLHLYVSEEVAAKARQRDEASGRKTYACLGSSLKIGNRRKG